MRGRKSKAMYASAPGKFGPDFQRSFDNICDCRASAAEGAGGFMAAVLLNRNMR